MNALTKNTYPPSPAPSNLLAMARRFYQMKVNVVPAYAGSKTAFGSWGYAKVTGRLPLPVLSIVFSTPCNLALITGATSENLFVFECDSSDAFQKILGRLQAENLPIFAQWSGGGNGRGHFLYKCADGVVAHIKEGGLADFPDMGIRSEGNYVIGAGSRIASGAYRLFEGNTVREIPTLPLYTLQKIVPGLSLAKKSFRTAARPRQELHPGTRNFLAGRTTQDGYHRHLFAAACDLSANGRSPQEVFNQLFPVAEALAQSVKEVQQIAGTIERACKKVRKTGQELSHPRSAPPPKTLTVWERAMAWVDTQPMSFWQGKQGQTDFKVLHALVERCRMDENPQAFRASVRELAKDAHVWSATIESSLKRLREKGFIEKVCDAGGKPICAPNSQAHLYRFGTALAQFDPPPENEKEENSANRTVVATCSLEKHHVLIHGVTADLAENKALGAWGVLVYSAIKRLNHDLTVQEVVSITGFSERQIRAILPLLRDAGLIAHVKRGQWQVLGLCDSEVKKLPVYAAGRASASKRRHWIFQERQRWLVNQMIVNGLTQLSDAASAQFLAVVTQAAEWLWEEDYISATLYYGLKSGVVSLDALLQPELARMAAPPPLLDAPSRLLASESPVLLKSADVGAAVSPPVPVSPLESPPSAISPSHPESPSVVYCFVCGQQTIALTPLPSSCPHCRAAYGLKEVEWVDHPRRHDLPPRPEKGEDLLTWFAVHVLGACLGGGSDRRT